MVKTDVIIIGGGAAGYFAANQLMEQKPSLHVILLEKTNKTLSKVKVSGGGRCNVTNQEENPRFLAQHYPRGEKTLKNTFKTFGSKEVKEWFNKKGAELKTEPDGRVFPSSNSSQTILDILRKVENHKNFQLFTQTSATSYQQKDNKWIVSSEEETFEASYVLITTGGVTQKSLQPLTDLGINIVPPTPSLFTFNLDLDNSTLKNLQGVATQQATLKILGSKLAAQGPLLFTHWGVSGPVVLRLSSWGARVLAEKRYQFAIHINFANISYEEVKTELLQAQIDNGNKLVKNTPLYTLPKKLWLFILHRASIEESDAWSNLSQKKLNKLNNELSQGEYSVKGKSTFKEEFVTAGGVDLAEIDKNYQHKTLHNLYFAGEILDVDAITGGFNFQAAWSTAYMAARSITSSGN
ncbi:NAD(P)/FAD-dependent oxidoreductase [Cyclobacteriaceae bacterium]|nr:NAD(P)/FAD-dependent oxidoreductase [Cyclobacteriaceae bacterium]